MEVESTKLKFYLWLRMKDYKTYRENFTKGVAVSFLLLSGVFVFSFWLGLTQFEAQEKTFSEWIIEENSESIKEVYVPKFSSGLKKTIPPFSFYEHSFKELLFYKNKLFSVHYQWFKELYFNNLTNLPALKIRSILPNSNIESYLSPFVFS